MSNTVAKGLKFYGDENLLRGTNYKDLSDFISLKNDWLDIFNSTLMNSNASTSKSAYGVHLKKQN